MNTYQIITTCLLAVLVLGTLLIAGAWEKQARGWRKNYITLQRSYDSLRKQHADLVDRMVSREYREECVDEWLAEDFDEEYYDNLGTPQGIPATPETIKAMYDSMATGDLTSSVERIPIMPVSWPENNKQRSSWDGSILKGTPAQYCGGNLPTVPTNREIAEKVAKDLGLAGPEDKQGSEPNETPQP